MVAITDKFGKASIDSNYAIATTVDATRTAGVTVLDAVDLSKFNADTPVFVVTYKKTTDPLTGDVSVSNLVSYKALVNTGANTLTNLTVAPGYTDIGNDIGDFIECVPTSYWVNSMMDGIFVGHNPDGSFKASAIRTALGIDASSFAGWNNIGATVGSITPKGNRSLEVVLNSYDARPVITEGMRVRTTRTIPASNTSFSLDGVNDYYVKTSPNKMTWTDDFAQGWWIYPTAYPASYGAIASRYNGTSGWEFLIDSKGAVILIGHNAGSGNFRGVTSHQSVPLNKWTFVAAQLDMSAHTPTPTTSYVKMNGVDVPAYVSQSGSNPTALIQAGNFEVGSTNGGTNPFPGYIGDGGVFSAKVPQATMLGYMNQPLTGSETNLASGYKNGSVTDLNVTTPNNLVATNGATTVANAPYGDRGTSTTLDYGVVMTKPVFAVGDTTLTIQVPEGCTIPSTGGVSSIDYSGNDIPYGFPRDKGRWSVEAKYKATQAFTASPTYTQIPGRELICPIGSWRPSIVGAMYFDKGSPPNQNSRWTLSTASSITETHDELTSYAEINIPSPSSNLFAHIPVNRSSKNSIITTTPTKFYLLASAANAGSMGDGAGNSPTIITFENAYI